MPPNTQPSLNFLNMPSSFWAQVLCTSVPSVWSTLCPVFMGLDPFRIHISAHTSSSFRGLLWPLNLEEVLFISIPTLLSMTRTDSLNYLFIYLLLCYHFLCSNRISLRRRPLSVSSPVSPGLRQSWHLQDPHSIKIGLINISSNRAFDYMSAALLKALHLPYILLKNYYEGIVIIFSTLHKWLMLKPEIRARATWYLSPFYFLALCFAVLFEKMDEHYDKTRRKEFFNLKLLSM